MIYSLIKLLQSVILESRLHILSSLGANGIDLGALPVGVSQLGAGGFKGGVVHWPRLVVRCQTGGRQRQLLVVSGPLAL